MRRGRPGNPYRAAVAALQAGIAARLKQNAADESLIADLSARAGIDGGAAGTRGTTHAAQAKPAPKRRRRRRHSATRHTARHSAPRRRQKPDIEPEQVAAPAPTVAKVEPAKAVRGAALFKDQYQELERLGAGIAESGDNIEVANKLRLRADAVGRSMGGKGTYPPFFTKSERMRCRRLAAIADKSEVASETEAPKRKKRKAPRKKTPPPVPPVKRDSGWRVDENGVRSREVLTT